MWHQLPTKYQRSTLKKGTPYEVEKPSLSKLLLNVVRVFVVNVVPQTHLPK
jgi:hypothetical protein